MANGITWIFLCIFKTLSSYQIKFCFGTMELQAKQQQKTFKNDKFVEIIQKKIKKGKKNQNGKHDMCLLCCIHSIEFCMILQRVE